MTHNEQRPSITRLGTGRDYLEGNPFTNRPHPWSLNHDPNWDLRRIAQRDSQRHEELVKKALEAGLGEELAKGGFEAFDGKKRIKVPIQEKVLYKFIFRRDGKGAVGVGSGDGKSETGDIIAGDKKGKEGKIQQGGEGGEGEAEFDEADTTSDTLKNILGNVFEELELPIRHDGSDEDNVKVRFNDVRKTGPMGNLDKKRTLIQNLTRNAARGNPHIGGIHPSDLRFKTWDTEKTLRPAVVFVMMDISASMGEQERQTAKALAKAQYLFLQTKYPKVETVFVAHSSWAKQYDNADEFFKLSGGLGGGTDTYEAFAKVNGMIDKKYRKGIYDIFGLYLGDGDDNPAKASNCQEEAEKFIEQAVQLGFGEIVSEHHSDSLLHKNLEKAAQRGDKNRYVRVRIPDPSFTVRALRTLYPKGGRRAA